MGVMNYTVQEQTVFSQTLHWLDKEIVKLQSGNKKKNKDSNKLPLNWNGRDGNST